MFNRMDILLLWGFHGQVIPTYFALYIMTVKARKALQVTILCVRTDELCAYPAKIAHVAKLV